MAHHVHARDAAQTATTRVAEYLDLTDAFEAVRDSELKTREHDGRGVLLLSKRTQERRR
jgi:hypothetical protein